MAVSLVSYDSSDDYSEEESYSNNANGNWEADGQKKTCTELKQDDKNVQVSNSSGYIKHDKTLEPDEKVVKDADSFPPLPKANFHDTDIDWNRFKILKDTQYGTIKITVPALSEIEDDNSYEPEKKKLKPSQKGSGLFALLPSPKKQNKLIPHAVSSKINDNSCYVTNNSYSNMERKQTVGVASECVENFEELNFDKGNDFFSLSSGEINSVSPSNNTAGFLTNVYEDEEVSDVQAYGSGLESEPSSTNLQQAPLLPSAVFEKESSHSNTVASCISAENNLKLNDIALQQLCGKRDRHKFKTENVELIEISGDSIMPDSREWLTKQLTEENQYVTAQSHKKKDGPTSQQKRKHQITYLAFQAKEHELELKNQWASNRMSRKQTQAKYGF